MQRDRFLSFNPPHTMSESMANALRAAARLRDIAHQVSELGQHYFAPPPSFQLLRYDSLNIVTCGLHKRRRFQVRRAVGGGGYVMLVLGRFPCR